MQMSRFAIALILGLVSPAGAANRGFAADGPVPRPKPNFVIILIDDLGWRDVGCFGNTFHETPNIDRLARRGMKFTYAYATCCVCSPSRASILTGKYPARLHLTDYIGAAPPQNARLNIPNWIPHLPPEAPTLAEALKPAGYVSACVGKWHLGGDAAAVPPERRDRFSPERRGFDVNIGASHLGQTPDYFFPYRRAYPGGRLYQLANLPGGREGEYLTDRLTDEAEKFIETNKARRFFLYFSQYAVHTAMGARLQAKSDTIAKYQAKQKRGSAQQIPVYAAMVESMDESVGRILRKLADLKLDERTVVIFTSDNGGYGAVTSNAPLRGAKASAYEGGVRVPLIVSWPGGVKPGTICDVPVAGVDFYPTVLEIAGVKEKATQAIDGESLVPLLTHQGGLRRDALFWHYPHYGEGTTPYGSVRRRDDKLIEFYEGGRLELYNLKVDSAEQHDLASKLPEKARELRNLLAGWRKQVRAQMPVPKEQP